MKQVTQRLRDGSVSARRVLVDLRASLLSAGSLDDDVALSARVPPSLKPKHKAPKYIFRQAMEGVLPKAAIWRPKAGFTGPVRAWPVGNVRPAVAEPLSPASVRSRGIFEPQAVQRLIAENERDEADHSLRVRALPTLELGQCPFIDGDAAAPLDSLPRVSSACTGPTKPVSPTQHEGGPS
jgi:asparagine synthetase B (glutamine-hydrolysing)